jgi:protocatechuate 3,4-dioxygenase beta subunit
MQRDLENKSPKIRYLSRREMLSLMGSSAAAIVFVGCGGGEQSSSQSSSSSEEASTCVVKPEQTEGPYFVDTQLNRSDIREEREGVPIDLTFNVSTIDAEAACTPLAGALVDLWQCDALGQYSGVENNQGETFLRGHQLTDESGSVRFTTIYPGWYQGRAVHMHFKIRDSPASEQGYEFTSQLYFDDALTDEVHSQEPYAQKGERDRRNSDDGIYGGGGGELTLPLSEAGEGYQATFDIALDTSYG